MEELAVEINTATLSRLDSAITPRERIAAFVELTKPRITFLIVLTSAAGFYLASVGSVNYRLLLSSMFGITLLSSGVATINQYMERDLDGLMRRTANRPLPTGKLLPWEALAFGGGLIVLSEIYLAVLVNPLTALMGLTVIAGYLFGYTPLKTKTSLSTMVGAFPGAVPPLIGWTAARGELSLEAWVLFAIMFLWQIPHTLAIAYLYREDFAKAGIQFLPVIDPDGASTNRQVLMHCGALWVVSFLPTLIGIAGALYFVTAFFLGAAFLSSGIKLVLTPSRASARRLLFASLIYLPMLLLVMALDLLPA